jgi:hypothetical protein
MSQQIETPQQALTTARMLWAALLAGQFAFFFVILFLIASAGPAQTPTDVPPARSLENLLLMVSTGLTAGVIPLAFFIRGQIYKRGWRGDRVMPRAYCAGMLVLLAMLEGASLFGLVVVLLAQTLWPYILPTAVCVSLQVANFPSGRPMQGDQFAALNDMGRERF